jgi:hypothetical protein
MILDELFAGGIAGVFKGVKDVVSTFKADPLEVLKIQSAVSQAELQTQVALVQAQTHVNEIEAANSNIFISGWRPAIGWICGTAYAYHFVIFPFLTFTITAVGFPIDIAKLPVIDWTELSVVLTGMLGLGALRTYEKVNK